MCLFSVLNGLLVLSSVCMYLTSMLNSNIMVMLYKQGLTS